MTPQLAIRSFSNDQYVLDKVFYSNFYRLRASKDVNTQPVILDIGAHCGYFTFAALSLGAKKVYAFEPFIENYKVLLKNIESSDIGKVVPYQLGVYTENVTLDFVYPQITKGVYYDFSDLNTEASDGSLVFKCPAFTLDYIFKNIIEEQIDVLKLSLGYAELNILKASSSIDKKVKNICVETSEDANAVDDFIKIMKSKGFIDSYIHKSAEDETFLVLLSQEKCENTFNLYYTN